MQADSHAQFGSVGSQRRLEPLSNFPHLDHAFACKASHDYGMICLRIRKSSDSNIAISNSFDFEHLSRLGNLVEGIVYRLKQLKDLRGVSSRGPGCETCSSEKGLANLCRDGSGDSSLKLTGDVGEHDRAFGEKIGNRPRPLFFSIQELIEALVLGCQWVVVS